MHSCVSLVICILCEYSLLWHILRELHQIIIFPFIYSPSFHWMCITIKYSMASSESLPCDCKVYLCTVVNLHPAALLQHLLGQTGLRARGGFPPPSVGRRPGLCLPAAGAWRSQVKSLYPGTSLVVQWLRFHIPMARGPGSIPGQGTRSHKLQLRAHMLVLKIPQGAMKIEDPACRSYNLAQPN